MEIKFIEQLAQVMSRSELDEVEIEDEKDGLRIHLKRGGVDTQGGAPVMPMATGGVPPATSAAPAAAALVGERQLPPGTVEFKSPMVGTFYRSPSPDAGPYVEVGAKVGEDTVLCIVEAMKVMNEIKAEMNGRIVECLVENAEPVE
ncbi:MAG: acetyl-CoA carboxylase biotin carboxyl carrier protein, partial [Planctomycetota bacterium]